MPKVSICIPTYEQVEYLKFTLESIIKQTYTDYEIIITDDSRTELVKNLIMSYDFKGRLKYFRNAMKLGSPENWNETMRKASGEYIKIMHHDEWFNYDFSLKVFVEALENDSSLIFAFSSARGYDARRDFYWHHKPTENQILNLKKDPLSLFFGNFIGSPSNIIFKRKKDTFFNSRLIWCVDFEFYIRSLLNHNNFLFIESDLITSVSNATHNVTNICLDNKKIEIFEYLYLFQAFKSNIKLRKFHTFLLFFSKLFTKYNIRKVKSIRECGYNDNLPFLIKFSMFINKVR